MSQQSVLPASLQTRSPHISLHLHHFSSITIFLSHFPLCLVFITPPLSLSSASFCSLCLLWVPSFSPPSRWRSRGPQTLVVPGFQMVWLAEGSGLTPRQLIPSYLKPPRGGVGGNTDLRQDERQRTGERDQGGCGVVVEGCGEERELHNRRTCHLLHLDLKQSEAVSFKSACTSELFEAQAHTLCYHSSAL